MKHVSGVTPWARVGAAVVLGMLWSSAGGSARGGEDSQLPQAEQARMSVLQPIGHSRSARLQDFIVPDTTAPDREAAPVRPTSQDRLAPGSGGSASTGGGTGGGGGTLDPALQRVYPASNKPLQVASFGGIAYNGVVPADTNIAVGSDHVVEVVNSQFAVYSKTGTLLVGPASLYAMFATMAGNDCSWRSGSDPIVQYDRLAGRWLVARYLFTPNILCVAVSQSSDATGAYHLYAYAFGPNTADYPKFGVWPDAYYFTANTFAPNNGAFIGAQACAFDRTSMLAGGAGTVICFQGNTGWHSLLPSDLDSATPPPAGSPNFFLQFDSNSLSLFKFHADFVTPSKSTFTGPTKIAVAKFAQPCGACVPQPEVTQTLESLGGRLMYRLSYRNFGTYESLLVNHAVQVALTGSNTQTGLRWYELRSPNTKPVVYQQSTFSPDTSSFRWMGSIAQDKMGNMFLGYSTSSAALYPSMRYTVRLATDPLNQMQPEGLIQAGFGSQLPRVDSTRDRWGDYASVAVDPTDGCTFWFATEYLTATGIDTWATHIYSAKFVGCGP